MIRRIVVLYGRIRRLLRLSRFVAVKWYFDEQTVWMVYDSHQQVYVTGSISFNRDTARRKIEALNDAAFT